jgi:hypothetical protein
VSKDTFLAHLVQYFEENGELVSSAQLCLWEEEEEEEEEELSVLIVVCFRVKVERRKMRKFNLTNATTYPVWSQASWSQPYRTSAEL